MRLNSKIAMVIAVAAVAVAASVAVAYGFTAPTTPHQDVALQVGQDMGSGYVGTYGTEIVLQPAVMTSIELPGDKFHFQAYVQDHDASGTPQVDASGTPVYTWKDFRDFEDIQLEDTNTVSPFGFALGQDDAVILSDGTVVTPKFPYKIRCEYKTAPAGVDPSGTPWPVASTSPKSYSETETVYLIKNSSTRTYISTSGTIKHAGTRFNFRVSPDSGIGKIAITVMKPGMANKHYTVYTNEDGMASATLKLGTTLGAYTVYAKFIGNIYGAPSSTAAKLVRAAH